MRHGRIKGSEKNKFDEKYEIRFAKYDEIDEVMQFIDSNWKEGLFKFLKTIGL